MFVMTMNKNGLKKVAVAAGCAVLLAVCGLTVTGAQGEEVHETSATGTAVVEAKNVKVKDTDDMITFLLSYGIEADIASAKLDKVQVPKLWDSSFVAFNEVIKESGLDLSKNKGKMVEKWEFIAPNRAEQGQTGYAILLVRKDKVVGGYTIQRPSGEVMPLQQAAIEPAPTAPVEKVMTEAEQITQTMGELSEEQINDIAQAGKAVGLTQEQIIAAGAKIEAAAEASGIMPTE